MGTRVKDIDSYLNDQYLMKYTGDLLETFGLTKESMKTDLIAPYMEEHRFFHSIEHIKYLLNKIHRGFFIDGTITDTQLEILVFAAWFHDIVYVPGQEKTNEEESAAVWGRYVKQWLHPYKWELEVRNIILSTIAHQGTTETEKFFNKIDMSGLYTDDEKEIAESEYQIFLEYQRFPFDKFKEGRLKFLTDTLKTSEHFLVDKIKKRIDWVNNFHPQIGVYAGSFNPFTIGHLNILEKAEQIFDKVIVLIGHNTSKSNNNYYDPYFPQDIISRKLKFRQVDKLESGFLTEYIANQEKSENADYTLVRGLRNGDDLSFEQNQLYFLNKFKPDLKTAFFLCDEEYSKISSSSIRAIAKIDKGEAARFII